MEKIFNHARTASVTSNVNCKTFKVSYLDEKGTVLNGTVMQLSDKDFQVFIQEKQVILNYLKCDDGAIICTLKSKRRIPWVDGICVEINKKLIGRG